MHEDFSELSITEYQSVNTPGPGRPRAKRYLLLLSTIAVVITLVAITLFSGKTFIVFANGTNLSARKISAILARNTRSRHSPEKTTIPPKAQSHSQAKSEKKKPVAKIPATASATILQKKITQALLKQKIAFLKEFGGQTKTKGSGGSVDPGQIKPIMLPSGSVMLTGTAPSVNDIKQWLASLTQQVNKQVSFEVHIYTVDLAKHKDDSSNLVSTFRKLVQKDEIDVSDMVSPKANTSKNALIITSSTLSPAKGIGQWKEGDAVIKALTTMGKIVSNSSRSVIAMNDEPTAINATTNTAYLTSMSTTLTTDKGAVTSLSPEVISTGFRAFIMPHITPEQDIRLDMHMSFSALKNLQTIALNGQYVQKPKVISFDSQEKSQLKSGNMLVLMEYLKKSKTAKDMSDAIPPQMMLVTIQAYL